MPDIAKNHSFVLPQQAADLRHLGQLIGSSPALIIAEIIDRHQGIVVLVTADMQQAQRLTEEIRQFTDHFVATLSDWETLPYDSFSPHQEIVSSRLAQLYQLPLMQKGVMVLPVNTLMQKVCPHSFLMAHALVIKKGQHLPPNNIRTRLEQAGYRCVEQVMAQGEFASRGALLDLFPMGSNQPYRIDFFDDDIDSIRTFDLDSQRTINDVFDINLLPAHEFPTDQRAIECFRSRWREQFEIRRDAEHIYQQVSKQLWPAGIEYWQPLFFNEPLSTLFNYLPNNSLFISYGDIQSSALQFWQDTKLRYEHRGVDPMRPLLSPNNLWLTAAELSGSLKQWPRIHLQTEKLTKKASHTNLNYAKLPDLSIQHQAKSPLNNLQYFIGQFAGSIVFSVESEGRREALQELLQQIKHHSSPLSLIPITKLDSLHTTGTYIIIGAAEQGFIDNNRQVAFICESDLLGERLIHQRRSTSRTINTDTSIRHLAELCTGQPVVHLEHGVGRYAGMTTIDTGGVQAEYLILHYAGEDKLYVPISSLHLISRYSGGNEENAPLHKLGGEVWSKARQKAAEKIRDVAAELLDIYAQREAKPGFPFRQDNEQYPLFCQMFPYETTFDQQNAIDAVLADMCSTNAMDRLVCGDVGFGKTEVAMRAAFLAVINNKQVSILVPTTLLAQQHYDNFRDRFANWPIRIEMISRFRTTKEQKLILADTEAGKVDILIGTHKLLQTDVHWKDLGLLIVDEEHRFGVRQKERIKAMRANVDILTLTATPIPRTLNMAISGMRDLSIIATPPARRLAVKTFIRQYDKLVIREALLREILRGGQVYYLFNDVENIQKTAEKLNELVPEARIAVGHGQMHERDLERVMTDFHHQRFNVLVCTTIIETGIDIPSANTIIIDRADRFGLAQLHQLRGRVGRSHHQAYAYLLTLNPKIITKDAQKRLEALASLEDLGAGFALATHDLEIRGAGELLGEDQSGQITTIGFSLYMELLERAVDSLKQGKEPSLDGLYSKQTEIELRIATLLPDNFISDVNTRLSFYKRIASAETEQELKQLKVELVDRFGALPEPALNLLQVAKLRQQAKTQGIQRIDSHHSGGFIEFSATNRIDPNYLIRLLQGSPQHYQLDGPTKLKFTLSLTKKAERLQFIETMLNEFANNLLK